MWTRISFSLRFFTSQIILQDHLFCSLEFNIQLLNYTDVVLFFILFFLDSFREWGRLCWFFISLPCRLNDRYRRGTFKTSPTPPTNYSCWDMHPSPIPHHPSSLRLSHFLLEESQKSSNTLRLGYFEYHSSVLYSPWWMHLSPLLHCLLSSMVLRPCSEFSFTLWYWLCIPTDSHCPLTILFPTFCFRCQQGFLLSSIARLSAIMRLR